MAIIDTQNPATLPDAGPIGYAQIASAGPGRLVAISGQVAVRADGTPPPATLAEQTEVVVANLGHALAAAGGSVDNLLSVRAFVVDLTPERVDQAMAIVRGFLGDHRPALTGVGVTALAAPGLQIEIEVLAVVADP